MSVAEFWDTVWGVGWAFAAAVVLFVGGPLAQEFGPPLWRRIRGVRHEHHEVVGATPEPGAATLPAASNDAAPTQAEMLIMAAREWLNLANHRPDTVAHLSVFGPSGSGKTTLAQAILDDRPGRVVIIDPKPQRRDRHTDQLEVKWGGAPYIRIDRDGSYTAIRAALGALRQELQRRLAHNDEEVFDDLTVVLDEYKLLAQDIPDLAPVFYKEATNIGRELRVRLLVLSTSERVESLGIKGQGDLRDSHLVISVTRQHRAVLSWDGEDYVLDTRPVLERKPRPFSISRWWPIPTSAAAFSDNSGRVPIPPNVPTDAHATNGANAHADAGADSGTRAASDVPAGDSGATDGLHVTADELGRLGRAVALRAQGATIQEAVETAFDVIKGNSQAYKRARRLFDAAMGTQALEGRRL